MERKDAQACSVYIHGHIIVWDAGDAAKERRRRARVGSRDICSDSNHRALILLEDIMRCQSTNINPVASRRML